MKRDIWIAGIARGHNSGVCLLKNGEIVFQIEEERLSRKKYDGGPYVSMMKILDYTDRLDFLVITHPVPEEKFVEYVGDDLYQGLARKLGLIDDISVNTPSTQVIHIHSEHHMHHAAAAFYRSGFESAAAVIVDGAGSAVNIETEEGPKLVWEVESIFNCKYPDVISNVYKKYGTDDQIVSIYEKNQKDDKGDTFELIIENACGIGKAYEAVTIYCGFDIMDCGKTMGLSSYGKLNDNVPKIFDAGVGYAKKWNTVNRDLIIAKFPGLPKLNIKKFTHLESYDDELTSNIKHTNDLSNLSNRRNMAHQVQIETQQEVLDLIIKASRETGQKNIVLSGGYALNCVANYWYLDKLNALGINLYIEPVSSDAGTAMGAAMLLYHRITKDFRILNKISTLYSGKNYNYSINDVKNATSKFKNFVIKKVSYSDIIKLIINNNIVSMFQGRSEHGPRALGNRSILFDPRTKDGKDYVNSVKHREYFRPFAAAILEEYAHEWFDLKDMKSSPHMMYAVDCLPGVKEKVPSVIHIDNTCRIQTVNKKQNLHFYNLIKEFKERTQVPLLFNTSFNLGGDPLVETIDDALLTLNNSDLKYCYFPELDCLVTKNTEV